jgi:hypothetical protein
VSVRVYQNLQVQMIISVEVDPSVSLGGIGHVVFALFARISKHIVEGDTLPFGARVIGVSQRRAKISIGHDYDSILKEYTATIHAFQMNSDGEKIFSVTASDCLALAAYR